MPYRDIEKRRAYGREWMRRNAAAARDAMRRWRERHREVDRKRKRDQYRVDRRRVIVRNAAYARAHPDVRLAIRHRRRAREQGGGGFSASAWLDLVAMYRGGCAYCGARRKLQADHRTPLSRGGTNQIDNILPACAPCNLSKHDRTESEFLIRKYGATLDGTTLAIVDWRALSPAVDAFELTASAK
jgi:5-methylcytosine-specific restriction endonuclease McrA